MTTDVLKHLTREFGEGRDLPVPEAETLFDALIKSDNEELITELLAAWNAKGTTEDELFMMATIMRARMKRIVSDQPNIVDIVGTGGSRSKTFNVSTAAAFVIAGAGVPVAKHGNRAATSSSGSADVLANLGINVDVSPEKSQACLDDIGICFMYAPLFHSLSPSLARARRALGRPTIFNNLGPLCNPAGAEHKMIGVWADERVEKTARVLARLGTKRSWVVFGEEGLDEISLYGRTFVADVHDNGVNVLSVNSSDFGSETTSGELPRSLPAVESARLVREIVGNKQRDSDAEKLVLINAAAAIFVAGSAPDLPEAFCIAKESVRSGAAMKKLSALAKATN